MWRKKCCNFFHQHLFFHSSVLILTICCFLTVFLGYFFYLLFCFLGEIMTNYLMNLTMIIIMNCSFDVWLNYLMLKITCTWKECLDVKENKRNKREHTCSVSIRFSCCGEKRPWWNTRSPLPSSLWPAKIDQQLVGRVPGQQSTHLARDGGSYLFVTFFFFSLINWKIKSSVRNTKQGESEEILIIRNRPFELNRH